MIRSSPSWIIACLVSAEVMTGAASGARRPVLKLLRRDNIEYGLVRVEVASNLALSSGEQGGSERLVADVDCKDRAILLKERDVAAKPGPDGGRLATRLQKDDWEPVDAGTLEAQVLDQACEEAKPRLRTGSKTASPPASSGPPARANAASPMIGYKIQVGSYLRPAQAQAALSRAGDLLHAGEETRSVEVGQSGRVQVFRAILTGFDRYDQAAQACSRLTNAQTPCLVRSSAPARKGL